MKKNFACAIFLLALVGPALAATVPIPPPDFAADFKKVDVNQDGKLSWEEFLEGRKYNEGLKHGEEARRPSYRWIVHYVVRFSQMDLNNDEVLTLDEYTKGRLLNVNYEGTPRYIRPKPDANKPTVTTAPAQKGHPEVTAAPDFSKDFAETDANHDGKLTWEEYFEGRKKREGAERGEEASRPSYRWMRHYVERFMAMDFNDDEVVTREEYMRGRLLNTYNDGTLRFLLPSPAAKAAAKKPNN